MTESLAAYTGSPSWTLGPLELDPAGHDREGVQWFLTEEQGFWAAPASTASVSHRINAHGGLRVPGWKKERSITLTGRAYADNGSFATLRRAAHRITSLLSNPIEPVELTCHSEIGSRTCEVFLDGDILTEPVLVATPCLEWSLQLVAPDPRLYGSGRYEMEVGLPKASLGDGLNFTEGAGVNLGLNFSKPDPENAKFHGLHFGTKNRQGIVTLTQQGTAPSPAVFTLWGPLDTPSVSTRVRGRDYRMTYNGKLADQEFVVIDPSVPSVLLQNHASRRELLNPAHFTAFEVAGGTVSQLGRLRIGLSHQGPWTPGRLTMSYRDAWF